MMSGYEHKVLVVGDEALIGTPLCPLLIMENLLPVCAPTGEAALERMKESVQPFSLIIADQPMPGMKGTQFFEHATSIHPDTICFLLTGYSEIQTLITSVNKGSVHRYIPKPWNTEKLIQTIRWGIERYERFLDNEKLFALAKKQNAKLYELNCELMEGAKHHTKSLMALDTEIQAMETQLKDLVSPGEKGLAGFPDRIMDKVHTVIAPLGKEGQKGLNDLFSQTIHLLLKEFREVALRNRFEMPEPVEESFDG